MTSSERKSTVLLAQDAHFQSAPWASDALLSSTSQAPRFMRTVWDEQAAAPFGPWRIAPRVDPLDVPPASTSPAEPVDSRAAAQMAESEDAPDAALPAQPAEPAALDFHTQAALQAAQDEAYERGLQAGLAQARAELEAERARERELLRHLSIELRALGDDPQRYHEPLRRLALHLAEQLVRAELQLSGQAISQLVRQALDHLEQPADKAVVSLHPSDLDRLKAMGPEALQGLELEVDAHLSPGSVRVRVHDTVVQDLIEHRLEALARPLLKDAEAWLSRSSLINPRPMRAGAPDIEDVQARPAAPAEDES